MTTPTDPSRWFVYNQPDGDEPQRYEAIRGSARRMAMVLTTVAPDNDDRARALDHLREAVMWANASIACRSFEYPLQPIDWSESL